jgi:hypothetical protein
VFKAFNVGVLALLLAACGAPRPRPAPQIPAKPAPTPNIALPASAYRIDANRSELRILVYRAGPLARLGHNHVMVNRALRGSVRAEAGASLFWLKVPVAGFVVDDVQARREEGGEFEGEISDDAKSGTLHNMLSAALLDADRFPEISIDCIGISPGTYANGAGAVTATVAIRVAGHQSTIEVPATIQSDSRQVSATGSLDLRQSALGLTPYSLMLGALQVQDAMTIKFRIIAEASQEPV